jgi:hypothetical protein
MHYFASLSPTEFITMLGTVAAMLTAFYGLVNKMLKSQEKERDADRTERKEFVRTIGDMKNASIRVAEATEKAAREAEQRNGHLAEISIQNKEAIIESIKQVTLTQKVKEQHVDHQVVEKKE